ncbi:MAG: RNA polymerase sigma factor [Alphaproteobacteria bacterium]
MDQVALQVRASYPKALATLIRLLGDITSAEDALQEALARAVEAWPRDGVPDNAVAWLVTTARRKAIDVHRRRGVETRYSQNIQAEDAGVVQPEDTVLEEALTLHLRDDLLRLLFTCCHPALGEEAQIALTLKTVAGLSVEEIASAFLVLPGAMERRLSRVKRKISEAKIPYDVPRASVLPERLRAVLAVVYLIFNEGYSASGNERLIRVELCDEAIRLARLLHRLFRDEPEVWGLLALLLLQHSRHRARLDGQGEIVLLDRQDRSLWDSRMTVEGRFLVEKALRMKRPGPYQVQAAIAAVHSEAMQPEATDWPQIAELYGVLERYQPSPVVTLNRAVAVAKASGAQAGLALLAGLEGLADMQRYHHFHAAKGALLEEAGRGAEAMGCYETALELTQNPSERRFIEQKLKSLA